MRWMDGSVWWADGLLDGSGWVRVGGRVEGGMGGCMGEHMVDQERDRPESCCLFI